ncbi:MAG: hypothetical protein ACYC9X_00655 [Dehalococcoidia bacterium]
MKLPRQSLDEIREDLARMAPGAVLEPRSGPTPRDGRELLTGIIAREAFKLWELSRSQVGAMSEEDLERLETLARCTKALGPAEPPPPAADDDRTVEELRRDAVS